MYYIRFANCVLSLELSFPGSSSLGWSERLEIQEQYDEVREERIEELSGNLVSCMTGEEGAGGKLNFERKMFCKIIRELFFVTNDCE